MVPGAELLFFWVIVVAIGGYLLISGVVAAFVYFICPESIKKWVLAVVILILIIMPINYVMKENHQAKEDAELIGRVAKEYFHSKEQANLVSDTYLQQVCNQESRLVVHKPLPAGADMLILVNLQALSPTTKLAPDVILTENMLEQNKVIAKSFPPIDIEEQYVKPLDWYPDVHMESVVDKWSIHSVVYPVGLYETPGYGYFRLARKSVWLQELVSGLVTKEVSEQLSGDYFYKLHDNDFMDPVRMPEPMREAEYTITIKDISTLKDREHWVARGKIELKNSGKVIAEYVGFQQLYFNNTACGNIKKTTNVDPEEDVLSYFIEQISKNEILTNVKS